MSSFGELMDRYEAVCQELADTKDQLAASKTEANDLRVRVEGLLLEIEGR